MNCASRTRVCLFCHDAFRAAARRLLPGESFCRSFAGETRGYGLRRISPPPTPPTYLPVNSKLTQTVDCTWPSESETGKSPKNKLHVLFICFCFACRLAKIAVPPPPHGDAASWSSLEGGGGGDPWPDRTTTNLKNQKS